MAKAPARAITQPEKESRPAAPAGRAARKKGSGGRARIVGFRGVTQRTQDELKEIAAWDELKVPVGELAEYALRWFIDGVKKGRIPMPQRRVVDSKFTLFEKR